jgi:hypothetical protein
VLPTSASWSAGDRREHETGQWTDKRDHELVAGGAGLATDVRYPTENEQGDAVYAETALAGDERVAELVNQNGPEQYERADDAQQYIDDKALTGQTLRKVAHRQRPRNQRERK